jgi:phage baseplate assembly protein gpV/phage protein D
MMQTQAPPLVRIAIAGQPLGDAAAAAVQGVRVQFRLGMPAQCVLTFDLADTGRVSGFSVPSVGDPVRVDVDGQTKTLFAGEVTGLEYVYAAGGAHLLRVRAYDLLHRLRQRQSVKVHEGVTLADLAAALSDGTGLSVDAPDTPHWERLYQYRQSDLELLRDIAGRCGRFPVVDDDVLKLVSLAGDGDPLELRLGDSLLCARVDVTAEPGFRSVRAYRWDAAAASSASPEANESGAGAQVALQVDPGATGGGGERVLVDEAAPDDDIPAALAAATLDVMVAGEVTASLIAEGNTAIRPGRPLNLAGIAADVAGSYVVTDALHVADGDGYTVTVSSRPPAVPSAPAASVVTLGTVSDVSDPQHLARVRVRLDAYGGLESGWAPVILPAAGDTKGALILPDVDDRVAVLLPHGDPNESAVVGGLFGTSSPPQDPIAGDRVRRWAIQAANGQKLLFDADAKRLRLEGHNGSFVELGDDLATFSAATDLVIEAPGKKLTIKAQAVDFEEAG